MNQRSHSHFIARLALINALGLFICILILAGLGWLCQEVWNKETFQFDTTLLLWIHARSNPLFDQLMLSITRLGNPAIVLPIVLVNFSWFIWKKQRIEALMLIVACAGALVLNQGLKLVFARPRPTLWTPLIREVSYGFPSGHALGSLVLYGFLAFVFAHWYPKQSQWIYGIAVGTIGLIGFSRLYLGVHFPTDIMAGYGIGFLWLVICTVSMKRFIKRSAD